MGAIYKVKRPVSVGVRAVIVALPLLAFAIYQLQIVETNSYRGMVDVQVSLPGFIVGAIWLFLTVALYPLCIARPSDLFLMFYLLFSVMWGCTLWGVSGYVDIRRSYMVMVLSVFPVIFLLLARNARIFSVKRKISWGFALPQDGLLWVLMSILLVTAAIGYMTMGESGGFEFDLMHDRRMEGRDAFPERSFKAYLNMTAANGLTPLLAFLGGYRRKWSLLVVALGFAIFEFWLLGLKSVTLFVVLMCLTGYSMRKGIHTSITWLLPVALLLSFSVSLLEYLASDFSIIAEILVRRIAIVVPQLQGFYIDLWLKGGDWGHLLLGSSLSGYADVTFLVGSQYLGNDLTNANTSAFFYALGKGGMFGYSIAVVFVAFFFIVADMVHRSTGSPAVMAVAAIYSILISEQSFTTAFVSSGVALGFVLGILFSCPRTVVAGDS